MSMALPELNISNSPFVTIIRPADMWIGDLLFLRTNRSLKYNENGIPIILAETLPWTEELRPRLVHSVGWLAVHMDAILLNFVLLALNLRKTRQQAAHKKMQYLLGCLAVCNILLAVGLFAYTFLVDVYYNVDSLDTLVALNEQQQAGGNNNADIWHFAKLLIHSLLVEDMLCVQQWALFAASLDRYLTLFDRYSPQAGHKWLMLCLCALPFLAGLLLFDRRLLLGLCMDSEQTVNLVRLLALLCPLCLSLVFCTCSIIGLLQQHKMLRRVFGQLFRDELSLSLCLFVILLMDAVAKLGIFLELLQTTFSIRITTGNGERVAEDAELHQALASYFSLAHFLVQLSPLSQSLLCLLGVRFYRRRLFAVGRRLFCQLCLCRRQPRLDYSCETMRSIIADQTRARQMAAGGGRFGRAWGEEQQSAPPRRK